MTILILLIIISLFSFNILNQVNNEAKITGMNANKNRLENNIYNNFLEIVEKDGLLEAEMLEVFKNRNALSLGEKIKIDNRNFFISFYKDIDGEVKLLVDERDIRDNSLIISYGQIIKDLFKDDLIIYESLNQINKEYLDKFMENLSNYENSYIKKYDSIEDPKELQDSYRIKYIEGNLNVDEDIEIQGIIVVNGEIIIEEAASLEVTGKIICKDATNIDAINIDGEKENIILYYSKYIPCFLNYKPEVIKIY